MLALRIFYPLCRRKRKVPTSRKTLDLVWGVYFNQTLLYGQISNELNSRELPCSVGKRPWSVFPVRGVDKKQVREWGKVCVCEKTWNLDLSDGEVSHIHSPFLLCPLTPTYFFPSFYSGDMSPSFLFSLKTSNLVHLYKTSWYTNWSQTWKE